MQKYTSKTALAFLGDRLFLAVVTGGLGIGWFIGLWGLSLPALSAGVAFGGILWLCVRQLKKVNSERHEKERRRMIGGELALKRLLLMEPHSAAKQAAIWSAEKFPMTIEKAEEWEIQGRLYGKGTLLRLIAQHESQAVTAQQVIECARIASKKRMEQCILCTTAPLSKEAREFAFQSEPPIHIITREELIYLAGTHHPATDEDLQFLAQRKRQKHTANEWCNIVLSPDRTKRYFCYAIGLGILAMLTGEPFYPIPAFACLTLYAASRLRMFLTVSHRRWKEQSTAPLKVPRRER